MPFPISFGTIVLVIVGVAIFYFLVLRKKERGEDLDYKDKLGANPPFVLNLMMHKTQGHFFLVEAEAIDETMAMCPGANTARGCYGTVLSNRSWLRDGPIRLSVARSVDAASLAPRPDTAVRLDVGRRKAPCTSNFLPSEETTAPQPCMM